MADSPPRSSKPSNSVLPSDTVLLVAVFLISTSLLITEVLFVRLASILFYPVATYLVISLALLGFGFGGTFLAVRRSAITSPTQWASRACIGFALTLIVALAAIWYAGSTSSLNLMLSVALGLPFAFGGIALALTFGIPNQAVNRVYFADLIGAGLGAVIVLFGLPLLGGIKLGLLVAGIGLLAAGLFILEQKRRAGTLWIVLGLGVAVLLPFLTLPKGITPIAKKELADFVRLGTGVNWEHQGWSALARIDVLSLPNDRVELPQAFDYKLVTQDGGAPSILLNMPDIKRADFTDHTIFGIPYWIKSQPKVLIIGLGGGPDVQAALHSDAISITGVEVNPQMLEIVKGQFADFTGRPYEDPRVTIIEGDGRHVVRRATEKYDIVQLTGVDTSVASLGGNPNLAENFLYTVGAFRDYYQHLAVDGVLSVSFPDVEGLGLRLVATAVTALREEGVAAPDTHIVISLTGGFVHMLIKQTPLTSQEIEAIEKHFSEPMWGLYFPLYSRLFGTPSEKFSIHKILYSPGKAQSQLYQDYWTALANGNEQAFLNSQQQTVTPPTDNWPFFFVLDKWGYNAPNLQTLSITLLFLVAAALIFILAPLIAQRRGQTFGRLSVVLYFAALGLGFIFIEVVLIQKLALFLGHPSYALTITLATLLISSGIGSLVGARRDPANASARSVRKIQIVGICIGLASFAAAVGMNTLLDRLLFLPVVARFAAAVLLVGAFGFLMGIPFPTGMAVLKGTAPSAVSWAWAINSTATVIGTVSAVLLAMLYGFTLVFVAAGVLYLVSVVTGSLAFSSTS